jgi:NAD(P)-dependent dehydrogenase (short-subunit alcohol dehydrogenase family)
VDKVALVTGGSRGIGRATAELFAEEGATVVVGDKDEPEPFANPAIEWDRLDVTKLDDWTRVVEAAVGRHGRIDVLFNNAGLVGSYDDIHSIPLEAWQHVVDVNLNGVFYGMRTLIPVMQRAGGGSIINVSSIWGIVGADGVSAYQASKGAVRTLTKNAAITYVADGIRVNSVHPGLISTPMIAAQDAAVTDAVIEATPMKRAADPREVAYGVLFLASDESSFVTGAELPIDGGYTAQ